MRPGGPSIGPVCRAGVARCAGRPVGGPIDGGQLPLHHRCRRPLCRSGHGGGRQGAARVEVPTLGSACDGGGGDGGAVALGRLVPFCRVLPRTLQAGGGDL
eukprot:scaffold47141_cov27-Phaeocystis_antarctica.AAC.1